MTLLAPETINPLALPAVPLSARSQLPNIPGIYFVLDAEDNVLYIGRAKSFCFRWVNHHRLADFSAITHGRIAYLAVTDSGLLHDIEKALIRYFQPSLNNRIIAPRDYYPTVVRLPPELLKALKDAAQAGGRSLNEQMLLVLREGLIRYKTVVRPVAEPLTCHAHVAAD